VGAALAIEVSLLGAAAAIFAAVVSVHARTASAVAASMALVSGLLYLPAARR
jgi:hypothetical protein